MLAVILRKNIKRNLETLACKSQITELQVPSGLKYEWVTRPILERLQYVIYRYTG